MSWLKCSSVTRLFSRKSSSLELSRELLRRLKTWARRPEPRLARATSRPEASQLVVAKIGPPLLGAAAFFFSQALSPGTPFRARSRTRSWAALGSNRYTRRPAHAARGRD